MAGAGQVARFHQPKLRPGVDVHSLREPAVCQLAVPCLNVCFAVSSHPSSCLAVMDPDRGNISIHQNTGGDNPRLEKIHDFNFRSDRNPLNLYHYERMVFDGSGNVLVPEYCGAHIHRYNINGQMLPSLPKCPVGRIAGIQCDPGGRVYISVCRTHSGAILYLDRDAEEWSLFYLSSRIDSHTNEDEAIQYSTKSFTPGQLAFGPDGYLYVATDTCIMVMDPKDGSVVRQIGVEQHKNGKMSRPYGIFVSGDGLVFVGDAYSRMLVFQADDAAFVCKMFPQSQFLFSFSWNISIDWAGYMYIADSRDTEVDTVLVF